MSWWTHFRVRHIPKPPHQFRTNLPWNCMEMHEFTYRKSFEILVLWMNMELYWYMKSSDILRYLISYISKLLYLQRFFRLNNNFLTNSAPILTGNGGALRKQLYRVCQGCIGDENIVPVCRKSKFITTIHCNIEKMKFQYVLLFLVPAKSTKGQLVCFSRITAIRNTLPGNRR